MVQPNDITSPYNQGYRDGRKAERERHKAAASVAAVVACGSINTMEKLLLNSLDCTAAWLENDCDPKQAAAELRLDIELLKGRLANG
jgi:hypothetical protein